MSINKRVREIRQLLGMNQTDFGEKIAVKQGYLANIESGQREVTEKIIRLILAKYNVNEQWLRTGDGELFVKNSATDINNMIFDLGLSEFAADIAIAYHKLEPRYRNAIKQLVAEMLHKHDSEVSAESTPTQEELSRKEQANLLRARADALEKKDAESTTGEKHA